VEPAKVVVFLARGTAGRRPLLIDGAAVLERLGKDGHSSLSIDAPVGAHEDADALVVSLNVSFPSTPLGKFNDFFSMSVAADLANRLVAGV